MIIFEGSISEDCRKYLKFKLWHSLIIFGLTFFLLVGVIVVLLACLIDWIFLVFFICPFAMFVALLYTPRKIAKRYPQNIIIQDEVIYYSAMGGVTYGRELKDIKKIADMGDWYNFEFYFPRKELFFVCQKDLITEGSIEEFETLFEGKIVRKKFKK